MANTILDAGGLKYVEMQNGRFARKPLPALFDGGAWTKLRLCLMLKVDDTGNDITGTPLFSFGLCSGTTNIPGDATPTNAIGLLTQNSTWTRSVASPTNERYFGLNYLLFKNVAGVETTGASTGGNGQLLLSTTTNTGAGSPLFVDITKGSPNFLVGSWYSTGNPTAPVISTAQYIAQSIASAPSFPNMDLVASQTLAFTEAGGTLDAAFIYFNQASGIRVLDWRVVRLS